MNKEDIKKGQLVWWAVSDFGYLEKNWSTPAVITEVTEDRYKVLSFDSFNTSELSINAEEPHWKKHMNVITKFEVEQYFEDIKNKADEELLKAQQRQKKAQRTYESGMERLKEFI
jgi:hypothetical protein